MHPFQGIMGSRNRCEFPAFFKGPLHSITDGIGINLPLELCKEIVKESSTPVFRTLMQNNS